MVVKKETKSQDDKTEGSKTEVSKETQAPNVRLASDAKPLGEGPVTVGTKVICKLPDADAQREGFYCEAAERLVQLYSGRFKLIVEKGR